MREFETEFSGFLNKKYTIGIDRKYTDTFKKIDNKYVQKGLDLVDQNRMQFEERMVGHRDRQLEAESLFIKESHKYYGCRGLYGILWHIIQGNPGIIFTDVTLSKWLSIPRTTVFYSIKKMIAKGDVIKLERGFKAAE